jgi:hypothetical protein
MIKLLLKWITSSIPYIIITLTLYFVYSLFFKKSESDQTAGTIPELRAAAQQQLTENSNFTPESIDVAIDKSIRIGELLGTAYSWYQISSWTEDDEGVFDILNLLGPEQIQNVQVAYARIYSRDLNNDLNKFLDKEWMDRIKNRI